MAENLDELPEWQEWADRQSAIGERFIPHDGKLVIDRRPAASDAEAAAEADVQRQHQVTLETARRLHALVIRRSNALTMVWEDLQPTVERYLEAVERETTSLPVVLPDLYQNSVALGSLLDQDEALRQQPEEGESPLPVDVRRVLLETVTAAALLSRAFPSNLERDAELAAFNRARDLQVAQDVIRRARDDERLTERDSAFLQQMEGTAARPGSQGEKSAGRITMTAGNLIVAGVGIAVMGGLTAAGPLGAGAATVLAAAWVNRSPFWQGFGDFVAQLEQPAAKLADSMPADVRAAILGFYRQLKPGPTDDSDMPEAEPAPPPEPVADFDLDLDRVVEMLVAGETLPEAWRPFIVRLDLSADPETGHWRASRGPRPAPLNKQLRALQKLEPLEDLTALQRLDLDNTQVTDLKPLERLTALQSLDLNNTKVADLKPLERLTALQSLYLIGTTVADLKPLERLTEPPRVCRRLQLLRGWSDDKQDDEQVFT